MSTRIFAVTLCLTASIISTTTLVFIEVPYKLWLISGSFVVSILMLVALIGSWLNLLSYVVNETAATLGQERVKDGFFSFSRFNQLKNNTHLIRKKFEMYAHYISRLGERGKQYEMDNLFAQDEVGKALMKLREELQDLRTEEDNRHWLADGLARFAEILRNKTDIHEYGQKIVTNLVKYLDASQGAFYVAYTDEAGENYLSMIAAHAYNGDSKEPVRIYEGQGILGQCMIDKDLVIISNVPRGYAVITSGLGEAEATSITVMPMMFNDDFYGIIELASFQKMNEVQLEFLKKVSVNIASEIASVKTIEQTQRLLDESNNLAEELKVSEVEMRKNLVELSISQEEARRKQVELNSYLAAMNNTIASVEFDLEGRFMIGNEIFLRIMGYSPQELCGVDLYSLMITDSSVRMMWENLRIGKFFSGEFRMRDKAGAEVWLNGTFNPIAGVDGKPEKVVMLAHFTTQERSRLNDLNQMVNALKYTLPVAEFDDELKCRTANEKFLKLFGVSRRELSGKTIHDFMAPYYRDIFENVSTEIMKRDFSTLLLPVQQQNRTVTYEASVAVANNADGKVSRVILLMVKEVAEQVSVRAAI